MTRTRDRVSNPYVVLGLTRFSTPEEANARYKSLLKKYHPDNLVTGNNVKFLELQRAWKQLKEMKEPFGFKGVVTHKTVFRFTWR